MNNHGAKVVQEYGEVKGLKKDTDKEVSVDGANHEL